MTPDTRYSFEVAAANVSGSTFAQPVNVTTPQQVTIDSNPASSEAYSPVPTTDTLFGAHGPSDLDVEQGEAGDCGLIASLAAVAVQDPQAIVNMFTYDGTTVVRGATVGVYTVRFYSAPNTPVSVTITSELPDAGGVYGYDHPVHGVLWVALAEKAYAVANGFGYVGSGEPDVNSYDIYNVGIDPSAAIEAITDNFSGDDAVNPSEMAAAWNSGAPVVIWTTNGTVSSPYIVQDHAYAVVGYDATTGKFQLLNAWGGTATSQMCPEDSGVYGLFSASAAFISDNFVEEAVGSPPGSPAIPQKHASLPIAFLLSASSSQGSAGVGVNNNTLDSSYSILGKNADRGQVLDATHEKSLLRTQQSENGSPVLQHSTDLIDDLSTSWGSGQSDNKKN